MRKENNWGLDLTHYGSCIASYKGEGILTLKDGQEITCAFEVGQLITGEIVLLCASESLSLFGFNISASKFEGTTTEGFKSFDVGRLSLTNYLSDRPRGRMGVWTAFHLSEMSVQMATSRAQTVHFGITNFKFIGTAPFRTATSSFLILPLTLKDKDGVATLAIRPLEQYSQIMLRVQTLKSINVTCEAVADIDNNGGVQRLEEVVTNLCYLLSVARGTKIQWIYRDHYDEKGDCVLRVHSAAITKPYGPLSVIDPRHEGREHTKAFLENAYGIYVERRDTYKLNKGTIDAYLDAKAESDYLETRGAKLAVSLEKLKAVSLALPSTAAKEFIIDEIKFNELIPQIKEAIGKILKDAGVVGDSRAEIYGKLRELNRGSFAPLLMQICNSIGLTASKDEIKLFIQCRNKLVHTGEFYCVAATPEEKAKCTPLASATEEYYFMVSFLDRIFLRLLGYSDEHVNWHSFIKDSVKKGAS